MNSHHRRIRPEDFDFDLRWWLVPAVLVLLALAAWLSVPSLDERARTLPAAMPQQSPEFWIGNEPTPDTAPVATGDSTAPLQSASAASAQHSNAQADTEDNHAPTF